MDESLEIPVGALLESIAVGGPLDGVKLAGPPTWDGRVRKRGEGILGPAIVFHPGNYIWKTINWRSAWTWVSTERPKKNRNAPII